MTPTQATAKRLERVWARQISMGKQVRVSTTARSRARRDASIVALQTAGFKRKEIAEILGMPEWSVKAAIHRLRKDGELKDTEVTVDVGLVPAALEQLEKLIEAGDKEAVLAVLKGRGVFKSHQAGVARGEAQVALTNLTVKFEMPAGAGAKPVLSGQVVGVPREPERG